LPSLRPQRIVRVAIPGGHGYREDRVVDVSPFSIRATTQRRCDWDVLLRAGLRPAQFILVYIYYHGLGGVPKDYATAANWWAKAAEQGLASAQARLGHMYSEGCHSVSYASETRQRGSPATSA
jgi:TPR repeat protein